MGRLQARMLGASVAIALSLVSGSVAVAQPTVVRVETRAYVTQVGGTLLNRTATGPTVAYSKDGAACTADSAIAALNAATGGNWAGTVTAGHLAVTRVMGLDAPPVATPPAPPAPWTWAIYVDGHGVTNDEACTPTKPVPAGSEVLLFPSCAGGVQTGSCFAGSPLYMKVRDGGPYDLAPQTVPGRGAPVVVKVAEDLAPSLNSTVTTDEGASFQTNDPHKVGETAVSFANFGPHDIIATEVDSLGKMKVPARMALCVSEGNDGFCGSPRVGPPDQIPYEASPCDTNGHDGLCGTIDKTGPVTNVTNITHKQVFARKKAPKLVTGTVAEDPAVVKNVRLRLTRTSTGRVLIKLKHRIRTSKKARRRYRMVKRCSAWDDSTALIEKTRCGTKYAKWFEADLDDLKQNFKYAFDLTLPAGAYTLEVQAADMDNNKDAPAPGRNVITFTVKTR